MYQQGFIDGIEWVERITKNNGSIKASELIREKINELNKELGYE